MRISDWSSDVCSSDIASHGALADHIPLKLRQCGKNAEHHPARWRRGVDLRALAGEHPQTDTAIRQILHRADQVGERSAEPVERPNDEDIAVAQRFQAGGKTGAIITATGCTIIIDIARSEEHTSELQSLMRISYAVFCMKKKNRVG